MPDRLTRQMINHPPNHADLPLIGVTVLVVDDSRLACDALRLMCRRLGARMRRADSLEGARLHLRLYRPDAVIVDLGLPDGRGEEMIRSLASSVGRPVILGLSGEGHGRALAMAAGADGYLDKPLEGLGKLQAVLQSLLPRYAMAAMALPDLALPDLALPVDPLALRDDLAFAAALLRDDPDLALCGYLVGFLGGVARQAQDPTLAAAVQSARPDRIRDALQARLALPDCAFVGLGLPLKG